MLSTPDLIDLNHYGLLCVSGAKAEEFLQGQLTCQVNDLPPQANRFGAHCNPQGRIVFLFHLFTFEGNFYLLLPKLLIARAIRTLKKYAIFFKVTLVDATENFVICGTESLDSLASPFIIRIPMTGKRSIVIYQKSALLPPRSDSQHWFLQNCLDKRPEIFPETSEKFLPHEINLPDFNGVDFNKGCYTGQEIIARMHYRGKLKKKLYVALSEKNPAPGAEIYNENASVVGNVLYCITQNERHHLLAVLDETALSPNLYFDTIAKNKITLMANEDQT